MTQTIAQAITQARFYAPEETYRLIQLPARAITAAAAVLAEIGEPFSALIVDKDEVTLVLENEAYEEYSHRLHGHEAQRQRWALITMDVVLDADLVGFIAVISREMANAGITLMPYAAFSRDHLLVPADRLQDALSTLAELQTTYANSNTGTLT